MCDKRASTKFGALSLLSVSQMVRCVCDRTIVLVSPLTFRTHSECNARKGLAWVIRAKASDVGSEPILTGAALPTNAGDAQKADFAKLNGLAQVAVLEAGKTGTLDDTS
ncbi:hypothetical protein SLH49_13000 [Cognatiyoonia sp. IB215446]|uniref:hypothetical protein n=1 Tax=Cognatiyoonia sp. IB215446 TaxID=3097355 RepID=UPI002A142819|nr:hypothetical protein [Cognatiyoonia sp. IB215446]MDX8348897.1 hypothetical protein [Cognatiyoonia sp. IB215446]